MRTADGDRQPRARTLLEAKIRERNMTLDEFAEYAETFARENHETGTLSTRHLQRLITGNATTPRPATRRLLEHIFGESSPNCSVRQMRRTRYRAGRSSPNGNAGLPTSPGSLLRRSALTRKQSTCSLPRWRTSDDSTGDLAPQHCSTHCGCMPTTSNTCCPTRSTGRLSVRSPSSSRTPTRSPDGSPLTAVRSRKRGATTAALARAPAPPSQPRCTPTPWPNRPLCSATSVTATTRSNSAAKPPARRRGAAAPGLLARRAHGEALALTINPRPARAFDTAYGSCRTSR